MALHAKIITKNFNNDVGSNIFSCPFEVTRATGTLLTLRVFETPGLCITFKHYTRKF
jgi:hypothetical protein